MSRPRMSGTAAALLQRLLDRTGEDRHRIILSEWSTTDWHSLTFSGQRHCASFAVHGDDAVQLIEQWTEGLRDAEFDLPRGFVAGIGVVGSARQRDDGAMVLELEALTISD